MIKTNDIVKVLAEEILKLEQKLTFSAEDSMRKLERITNTFQKYPSLNNNKHTIKFVQENQKKIELIRHRLDVFYKILKIITKNEENK